MNNSWRHLPPPARPIAAATAGAVAAVREGQEPDGDLAAQDPAQTGLILGTVVRLLLEDGHPDGLTADDVRTALSSCVRSWPEADPQVVLWLLAGALGVLEEDGAPAPKPDVLARHAVALITDLLAGRPVEPWLTAALADIERSQLHD
ncbi:hypothetical protein AMIS_72340 [Actinoplanes missouriensis 431]|uniref:Uncharacterized protein n=1 Tax=Actinoplanes missouriensis (strain ATCC 14538 / DSM 43046 / CBS 188.64 / JCM 3121 / NBRC 102363 / NCIMB 12654 / NRRL B-3342 / UNCC 431) TaxID=512565 RepID=I0HHG7_ACTM4|nr:hypothetical protein [Actinoplanes missouriensis]BAL92454.1 hypothetical protein AMIS_72340 [Actinoplanes missouriensis 431]